VLGAYGLSLVTLAIAAAPAVLGGTDARRARLLALAGAGAGLALHWGGGALRLARPAPPDSGVVVRVVQPDIPQAAKWSPEAFRAIVERYTALTGPPAARRPDVVVWPEAAIPAVAGELFAPGSWTAEAIAGALQPGQALLAGVVRTEGETYYNSLLGLRREGAGFAFLGVYDKHRLVPFGEYLPFEGLMSALGLKKLTAVEGGFAEGPEPAPASFGGLPRVQPLICYESLFPGFAAGDGPRPAWIVNVSNDAWFGRTSGPWQHLNLASYRAIEEGLPLIRATPTGVSAVVDAFGRTRRSLGPGERGIIDARLPGALARTPYARFGDAFFWALTVAGLACALRLRRRPA
jgi:apolipoprotein N-acyltransferase